jgi:MYXO-CTERM domain-containing protein
MFGAERLEGVICMQNRSRCVAGLLVLAVALLGPTAAWAENQDTLLFEQLATSGNNRCRGVRVLAEHDATVISFDFYTKATSGTDITWLMYESDSPSGVYTRIDQATQVTAGTVSANDFAWQTGPRMGVDVVGPRVVNNTTVNTYYAFLACWDTTQSVFYKYQGGAPTEDVAFGSFVGGATVSNFSTLGATASVATSTGYSFRIKSAAGETVDGQPAGMTTIFPTPSASPRTGGMIYRVDEPTILRGFKQLYNRTSACITLPPYLTCPSSTASTWYVMSCDEGSAAACDDAGDYDLVTSGSISGFGITLGEFWQGPDDLQLELEEGLVYFLGISEANDDIEYGYITNGVAASEDPSWGETQAGTFPSQHPLANPATLSDSSTYSFPQQVYTVAREGADYETASSYTNPTNYWYGQVFRVDDNTLLEEAAFRFLPGCEDDVRFAVYEGGGVTGPWTRVWQRDVEVTQGSLNAWVESGPIDLSLSSSANHYMLGIDMPGCSSVMDYTSNGGVKYTDFGQRRYGVKYPSSSMPSYIGSTSAYDTTNGSASWRVESCSTCADYDGDDATTATDCNDNDASINPSATEVCDGVDQDCDGSIDNGFDVDGDFVTTCNGDCNDNNADVYPQAPEYCDALDNDCDGTIDEGFDDDNDGYFDGSDAGCDSTYNQVDCNDGDGSVNPGASEACDGIDNDCDGTVDEGYDRDGDGYLNENDPGCEDTYPSSELDCDDNNFEVNPGAQEICNVGDDDCDGDVDEDFDVDTDGWFTGSVSACVSAYGDTDCNDYSSSVYPGAPEECNGSDDSCDGVVPGDEIDDDNDGQWECEGDCDDANSDIGFGFTERCDGYDNDCNGFVDGVDEVDFDGDRYLQCGWIAGGNPFYLGGSDCADDDANTYPTAPEICDGIDNDCDGTTADEGQDVDLDGENTCTDCNDTDANIYTGAPEICDGADSDCDGILESEELDEDLDGQLPCEGDCDDDNIYMYLGNPEVCDGLDNDCNPATSAAGGDEDEDVDAWLPCTGFVDHGVFNDLGVLLVGGGDCNDGDTAQFPGAAEACNGEDDDCDGSIDEGFDSDGDGHPNADDPGCAATYGGDADCDDGNPVVSPSASEVCNTIDDDCDTSVDEGFDADGDGHYDELVCDYGDDCDDANPSVSPSVTESCNGVDDDCDSSTDEGFDSDGDGFLSLAICGSPLGSDCDDSDPSQFPGASESCNGEDDDCDGSTDEGFDSDGDGHLSLAICGSYGDDCNDADATVSPSASEQCNRVDDNCDGNLPADEVDDDGDSMTECEGDCVDTDASILLGAPEACDGLDNDCDSTVDEGFDVDGDGFDSAETCLNGTDCDDLNPAINPDADEICDGEDNNCAGGVDEGFDADGDGYPTADDADCLVAYGDSADCDDSDATINPFAAEVCDDEDQNCDGDVDEGFDVDGDGFFSGGDPDCVATYADVDCDDSNAAAFPLNPEACDAADNDCDGDVDEDFDLDGDGWFTVSEPACSNAYPGGTDCDDGDDDRYPGNPEVCDGLDNNCDVAVPADETDGDGDGFNECADGDCDDTDAAQYVGAAEQCNAEDDDCDGSVDEDFDGDGDSYFTAGVPLCVSTYGVLADCDDSTAAVSPGATEVCNGIDDDCEGTIDAEFDFDGDGAWEENACVSAYPSSVLDCDDANSAVNPFQSEDCSNGIDDNCDGVTDQDSDLDGDGVSTCSGDCDDDDPTVYPAAPELCNQADDNCDGIVDDGFDADNDGFLVDTVECNVAYPSAEFDCDDGNSAVFPNAAEVCNASDDDCDGVSDEDFDLDMDTYFDGDDPGCAGAYADLDCDDLAAVVNPGVSEACNLVDDNCDSVVDEGFDSDGDGYLTGADDGCLANYADTDCDDADSSVSPAAAEACNGVDDNCDTLVPLEEIDNDGDGYVECDPPVSHVDPTVGGGDCDDANASVSPGTQEVCNNLDEDCDGDVDEDFDSDLDGFPTGAEPDCQANIGTGLDCDDNDDTVNPDEIEICDGVDQDCDLAVDEDFDADLDTFLTDDPSAACSGPNLDCDDDNAAVNPFELEDCSNGVDDNCNGQIDENIDDDGDGYSTCSGDCNDSDSTVYTGAPEVCDGLDQDCDGQADEDFDADSDGFLTDDVVAACDTIVPLPPLDCDDTNAALNPVADEACDGVDNDCDGLTDELFDADADGWFDRFNFDCFNYYGPLSTDCDDTDPLVNPDGVETCDGVDNDCDAITDEGIDGDGDGVWPDTVECQATYGDLGALDCDDNDDTIFPAFDGADAAPELCDLLDNDCDGLIPEDADDDAFPNADDADCQAEYPAEDLDCDDADADVSPDGDEDCNDLIDNDCDGDIDEDDQDCFQPTPADDDDSAGDDDDSAGDDDDATTDDDDATTDDDDATGDDDDATGDDDDSVDPPITSTAGATDDFATIAGGCSDCRTDVGGSDGGWMFALGLLGLLGLRRRRDGRTGVVLAVVLALSVPVLMPAPAAAQGALEQEAQRQVNFAWEELKAENYDKAISSADSALRLNPALYTAMVIKALAYEGKGELRRAESWLQTYLDLTANLSQAPEAVDLAGRLKEQLDGGAKRVEATATVKTGKDYGAFGDGSVIVGGLFGARGYGQTPCSGSAGCEAGAESRPGFWAFDTTDGTGGLSVQAEYFPGGWLLGPRVRYDLGAGEPVQHHDVTRGESPAHRLDVGAAFRLPLLKGLTKLHVIADVAFGVRSWVVYENLTRSSATSYQIPAPQLGGGIGVRIEPGRIVGIDVRGGIAGVLGGLGGIGEVNVSAGVGIRPVEPLQIRVGFDLRRNSLLVERGTSVAELTDLSVGAVVGAGVVF